MLQLQAPEEKLAELKPISIGTSTNLQVGQKVHLPVSDLLLGHTATFNLFPFTLQEMALAVLQVTTFECAGVCNRESLWAGPYPDTGADCLCCSVSVSEGLFLLACLPCHKPPHIAV